MNYRTPAKPLKSPYEDDDLDAPQPDSPVESDLESVFSDIDAGSIHSIEPNSNEIEFEEIGETIETASSSDEESNLESVIFSISKWGPKLQNIMLKTIIIEMSDVVVSFFSNDEDGEFYYNEEEYESQELLSFCSLLEEAITAVGGTAFIKNNWHAPKDASMFSLNHLLKVESSEDALNYVMYSDILIEDFARDVGTMKFCMAVRPWVDFHPAAEFRCIVVSNRLVGITPRKWPEYYQHYAEIRQDLISTVNAMFETHIKDSLALLDYVFDVVYHSPDNCLLWDISPLDDKTKLYAFNWAELVKLYEMAVPVQLTPVFRYLVEDCGILPPNLHYEQN